MTELDIPERVLATIREYRQRAIDLQLALDRAIAIGQLCPECLHRARVLKTVNRTQYLECADGHRFKRTLPVDGMGLRAERSEGVSDVRRISPCSGSRTDEPMAAIQRASARDGD